MLYANILNQIVGLDLSLANLLFALRDSLGVQIFLTITLLGKWWVAAAIVLFTAAIFYFKNYKKYIIPFFVSTGGSFLTGFLGKIIWQRPRPAGIAVYVEHSWSFPSGHAILAVALYGFLAYFFWHNLKKPASRIAALVFGLLIIFAVGFSRLYLGVHYLSDVVAGYLIGIFWLSVGIFLVKKSLLHN